MSNEYANKNEEAEEDTFVFAPFGSSKIAESFQREYISLFVIKGF